MTTNTCTTCSETPCNCGAVYADWSEAQLREKIIQLEEILCQRFPSNRRENVFISQRVGNLKQALMGIPNERFLACQLVGQKGGAWNLWPKLYPQVPNGTIAALTFEHEDLHYLPDGAFVNKEEASEFAALAKLSEREANLLGLGDAWRTFFDKR